MCPFPPKCLKNAKIFRAGKALLTTTHKQTRLTLVSTAGRRIRAILAKNRVDYYCIAPIFGESFFGLSPIFHNITTKQSKSATESSVRSVGRRVSVARRKRRFLSKENCDGKTPYSIMRKLKTHCKSLTVFRSRFIIMLTNVSRRE